MRQTIRLGEIVRDLVRSALAAGCSPGGIGFKPLCPLLGDSTINGYSLS
jgi:hypothetical protein